MTDLRHPNGIPAFAAPGGNEWWQRLYRNEEQLGRMAQHFGALQQQLEQTRQLLLLMQQQLDQTQRQLAEISSKPPMHIEYHFDQLKVNRLDGTLNVGLSPQGVQGIESFETPGSPCWTVGEVTDPVAGGVPPAAQLDLDALADSGPNGGGWNASGAGNAVKSNGSANVYGSGNGDAGKGEGAAAAPLPPAAEAAVRGLQAELAMYMDGEGAAEFAELAQASGIALDPYHYRRIINDIKRQLDARIRYYANTVPYPTGGDEQDRLDWIDGIRQKTRRDVHSAFGAYLNKLHAVDVDGQTNVNRKGERPR